MAWADEESIDASPAAVSAETMFVSFEIPSYFVFRQADDGSSLETDRVPSGVLLYFQLPFSGGIGLENYEIELNQEKDHRIATTLIAIYYTLPIPAVIISLGGGIGQSEVKGDGSNLFEKSIASQHFVRLGVPLGPLQIFGSFHYVFSRIKYKDNDSLLEAGGTMTSLGFGFGF